MTPPIDNTDLDKLDAAWGPYTAAMALCILTIVIVMVLATFNISLAWAAIPGAGMIVCVFYTMWKLL